MPEYLSDIPSSQLAGVYPNARARLKKRAEFLAVAAAGKKAIASTLVVQGMPLQPDNPQTRVGFTVTKKTGNAVVRNRIRRRLRAAVAENITRYGTAGWHYVIVGREAALDASYDVIVRDLRYALRKVVTNPVEGNFPLGKKKARKK